MLLGTVATPPVDADAQAAQQMAQQQASAVIQEYQCGGDTLALVQHLFSSPGKRELFCEWHRHAGANTLRAGGSAMAQAPLSPTPTPATCPTPVAVAYRFSLVPRRRLGPLQREPRSLAVGEWASERVGE